MFWIFVAVAALVVVIAVAAVVRRQHRNSGAPRAHGVKPHLANETDVHRHASLHKNQNFHSGGGGMPH